MAMIEGEGKKEERRNTEDKKESERGGLHRGNGRVWEGG